MSVKGDSFSSTLSESTLLFFKPSTRKGPGSCTAARYRLGITHRHSLTIITSPGTQSLWCEDVCGGEEFLWFLKRLRCHPYFSHSTHHIMKNPCSIKEGNKNKERIFPVLHHPCRTGLRFQSQLFCHHSPNTEL